MTSVTCKSESDTSSTESANHTTYKLISPIQNLNIPTYKLFLPIYPTIIETI